MGDASGTGGADGSVGVYDPTADVYVVDGYFLPPTQLPAPKTEDTPEDPPEDLEEWHNVLLQLEIEERPVSVAKAIGSTASAYGATAYGATAAYGAAAYGATAAYGAIAAKHVGKHARFVQSVSSDVTKVCVEELETRTGLRRGTTGTCVQSAVDIATTAVLLTAAQVVHICSFTTLPDGKEE